MKDGDSLSKFLLLGAILRDDRKRNIHATVAWHILDRWYEDHGNGWASVGYLQGRTGLTRGSVATATADLCAWGYFSRTMGAGKRPTAYVPNWAVSRVLWLSDDSSVLQPPDVISVLQLPDTLVLPRRDGKPGCVLQPREHPSLPNPLTSEVTVESSGASGAGLSAAPSAEDREGKITSAELTHDQGKDILVIELDGDPEDIVRIVIQSDDIQAQEEGQRELNQLADAVGVTFETDADVKRCEGRFIAIRHSRRDVDRISRHFEPWQTQHEAA